MFTVERTTKPVLVKKIILDDTKAVEIIVPAGVFAVVDENHVIHSEINPLTGKSVWNTFSRKCAAQSQADYLNRKI